MQPPSLETSRSHLAELPVPFWSRVLPSEAEGPACRAAVQMRQESAGLGISVISPFSFLPSRQFLVLDSKVL